VARIVFTYFCCVARVVFTYFCCVARVVFTYFCCVARVVFTYVSNNYIVTRHGARNHIDDHKVTFLGPLLILLSQYSLKIPALQ
jgi:hypothetical protein